MIKVEVHSTRAVIRSQEPLTVGLKGAKAQFVFGPDWADLIKTAVFRQGEKTVTLPDIGGEVTIPWEALTLPGVPVQIGVYGSNADGSVAIPTLWTKTAPVCPGADPEGDPSTEPTPGLWEQMQGKLGSLDRLTTNEKSSLVAAINEANRPVCVITVFDAGDGTYTSDHDVQAIQAKMDANVPVCCYWYEKNVMTYLADFQPHGPFTFTGISGVTEYCIVIKDPLEVDCSEIQLVQKKDVPTRTSQLQNDSGYLTAAPVTSVNGQTGKVELRPVYLVTLDSSNKVEQPYSDIIAAHQTGRDIQCNYKGYLLPLKGVMDDWCTFSGAIDTTSLTVLVRPNGNTIIYEHSLAKNTDIPKKTSQLENDSGYLTSVPVTSVNGQTGDVKVPTPVKVTVTQESDGNYTADRYCTELLEAHNAGSVVYCQWGSRLLPLLVASKAFCAFGCVYSGNIYTVTVGTTSVTVTAVALPSGGVNITDDGNGNVTIG